MDGATALAALLIIIDRLWRSSAQAVLR